ncbi:hypothetical protein [Bacillus sp. MRMR6]|uniref:hypothetical protein n=1 Tax=Bacillus sp. MRMR6 TaxID=1928617 RepID=UPI000951B143|nr:hypothetical protein [Bacillus sp. MRMR6]OLS35108.1 hypothetical protein BTR25_20230 [Bacillus sp. MRMR6]
MENEIATIYILENPEKSVIKFATGYQLRFENVLKDVFGVVSVNDLQMMLQFNKGFQESICKKNGIALNNISMDKIIRVANKMELLQLRKQSIEKLGKETYLTIPRPFDPIIKLQEGIFKWDELNSSYIPDNLGA